MTIHLESGQILLEKYRVLEKIGEGGMAEVWLAEELAFGGRKVALKLPRQGVAEEDARRLQQRFEREVKICAALEQVGAPNVVKVHTAEPADGQLMLVMQHMPGGDLAHKLAAREEGLPLDEALSMARDVLQALEAAHEHPLEIVHRDVSPDNVLFDDKGRAYLLDFGIAQVSTRSQDLTQALGGAVYGKPAYAAPELLRGDGGYVTPAADVYALGSVLFEMLTGQRRQRVRPGTAPGGLREGLPAWLDAVVLNALETDPFDRYASAREMLQALEAGSRVVEGDCDAVRQSGQTRKLPEDASAAWRRWLPRLIAAAAVVLAVILGAVSASQGGGVGAYEAGGGDPAVLQGGGEFGEEDPASGGGGIDETQASETPTARPVATAQLTPASYSRFAVGTADWHAELLPDGGREFLAVEVTADGHVLISLQQVGGDRCYNDDELAVRLNLNGVLTHSSLADPSGCRKSLFLELPQGEYTFEVANYGPEAVSVEVDVSGGRLIE